MVICNAFHAHMRSNQVSGFLLMLAVLCLLYAPDQTHRLLYAMAVAGVAFLSHHMNDQRVRYIYNHSYLY